MDNTKYEFVEIRDCESCPTINYDIFLKCKIHNEIFTIQYPSFMRNGTKGCSSCFKEKIQSVCKKDDSHFINLFFKSGKFIEGTIFSKNNTKTDKYGNFVYWDYYCPVCSNDEYVKNGLCSGVFTGTSSNLKSGCSACRCNGSVAKWTPEQRTYQIKQVVKEKEGTFLGWINGYKDSNSRFNWLCKENHLCNSKCEWAFYDLRSSTCSPYGFSKDLPASFYIVKWFNDKTKILKFGITNNEVITRVEQQAGKCDLSYEILYDFKFEKGNDAWILEQQYVKPNVERKVLSKNEMQDGYTETTHFYNLDKILKIVEKYNKSISV